MGKFVKFFDKLFGIESKANNIRKEMERKKEEGRHTVFVDMKNMKNIEKGVEDYSVDLDVTVIKGFMKSDNLDDCFILIDVNEVTHHGIVGRLIGEGSYDVLTDESRRVEYRHPQNWFEDEMYDAMRMVMPKKLLYSEVIDIDFWGNLVVEDYELRGGKVLIRKQGDIREVIFVGF